jgi:hypothetical protein
MLLGVLTNRARRTLAAVWFAILGFLVTTLLFLHQPMVFHGRFLFVVLPAISSGLAGYIWGGVILDFTETKGFRESLLRGIGVAGGAFAIFAALFAIALWQTEPGWGMSQMGGLFLATLTLGLLMVGSVVIITGFVGGGILYFLGRHAFAVR